MINSSPSESFSSKFASVKTSLKRLVSLYIENAKLTAMEKLSLFLSAAVMFIIAFILVMFGLGFLSIALMQLLQEVMSPIGAAAVVGGFFILLAVLLFLLRKPLIINPIARFISKLIMDIGQSKEFKQ